MSIDKPNPNSILAPAPTVWPLVTAFGIALVFTGLVTHIAVSAAGLLILLRAAAGWWRDVLPEEKHEALQIDSREEAAQIHVSSRAVDHLAAGTAGHRVRIPAEIHPYSAGVKGGIVGGAAMAFVAMMFGLIAQGSVWYPINLFAAGFIQSLAASTVAQLRQFSGAGLITAVIMHALISPLVGLLYAVLLPMFPRRAGLWSGLVTPVVWSGLIAATLSVINPTMNARIDWSWFVASQIAFGLTAGYVVARTERIDTMQSWPLAIRAGLETSGSKPEERGE